MTNPTIFTQLKMEYGWNFSISGLKMTWCVHGGISKKNSYGISTYDNWNFKPQISSTFHFDRVSDGQMAHILSVKWTISETIHKRCRHFNFFLDFIECHTISWKCNSYLVTINFETVPSGLQLNQRLQSTCYKWTVSRLKSTRQISARNSSPLSSPITMW